MTKRVIPTKLGADLESTDKRYDAHVRLEEGGGELLILVDIFDSRRRQPNAAHLESDNFPVSATGANEATLYLRDYGFDARVLTPQKRK
nr:hypothetical protein [Ferrimicrobium acidiphilum]